MPQPTDDGNDLHLQNPRGPFHDGSFLTAADVRRAGSTSSTRKVLSPRPELYTMVDTVAAPDPDGPPVSWLSSHERLPYRRSLTRLPSSTRRRPPTRSALVRKERFAPAHSTAEYETGQPIRARNSILPERSLISTFTGIFADKQAGSCDRTARGDRVSRPPPLARRDRQGAGDKAHSRKTELQPGAAEPQEKPGRRRLRRALTGRLTLVRPRRRRSPTCARLAHLFRPAAAAHQGRAAADRCSPA